MTEEQATYLYKFAGIKTQQEMVDELSVSMTLVRRWMRELHLSQTKARVAYRRTIQADVKAFMDKHGYSKENIRWAMKWGKGYP